MYYREKSFSENQKLVMHYIYSIEGISRAEIARKMNLTKVSISSIVGKLISLGYIYENDNTIRDTDLGRKPIALSINATKEYFIGIDIGANQTRICYANLEGIIFNVQKSDTIIQEPQSFVQELAKKIEKYISTLPFYHPPNAIGISVDGQVDQDNNNIIYSPNWNWENIPLANMISEKLKIPVYIENCTRALARADIWNKKQKTLENNFYVGLGFGIGSSLVIQNKVINTGSEWGHTKTNTHYTCTCGQVGCIEAVASGNNIIKNAIGRFSNLKATNTRDLAMLAHKGDQAAKIVFDEMGLCLGNSLANVANTIKLDNIVFGGGVSQSIDLFLDTLEHEFHKNVMHKMNEVKFYVCQQGDNASMLGAVVLVLQSLYYA